MKEMTTYVSVDEIQKKIINMSKKKIRKFVNRYLSVKRIGNRLYVNRAELERILEDSGKEDFQLSPE